MALKVNLQELETGQKHWLSPSVRHADIIERIRAKNRARNLAAHKTKTQMARAAAKIEKMAKKP
jgi:hypothetical protein